MEIEEEIWNFIKIWSMAIASACYAYSLSRIQTVIFRLLLILPVICLFTVLPLSLSSFHLGGPTIFYLVWLANFKLLLYSFHLPPLSTLPNISLPLFLSVALLPIKVNSSHRKQWAPPPPPPPRSKLRSCFLFGFKLLAFVFVIKLYDFRPHLPTFALLLNYCCHLYLGVEVTLAVTASLVRATLGLGLDPQFNEPYLATSLQDFWGRRWNLMVSDILRLSVYNPVHCVALPLVGKRWALIGGMLASFIVSGLMHEVIYFYFTRVRPTWEVTWFFVLHGVCTVVEVVVKEAINGRFRLHRLISGPLTIAFVGVTAWWLFLPQIIRNGYDVKLINEYPMILSFVKESISYVFKHVK